MLEDQKLVSRRMSRKTVGEVDPAVLRHPEGLDRWMGEIRRPSATDCGSAHTRSSTRTVHPPADARAVVATLTRVAIFRRKTARQRLRRATDESLTIPVFESPVDCTPWVIGGLWPTELSPNSAESMDLATYLNTDLRRIASHANDQLRSIRRAGMTDMGRRATEARVIDEARARAVRRVESTVRQLPASRGLPTLVSGADREAKASADAQQDDGVHD
jgi:hypothetical protein